MLKWLTGKDSDNNNHPLGSDSAIDQLIADLHPGRPETNLIALADDLGEPEHLSGRLTAQAVLRAVDRLDDAAQEFLPEVWKQVLLNNAIDHVGEQKLKALDTWYSAAVLANRHALRLLIQKPAIGGKNPVDTAVMLGSRAVRANVAKARIMHLRYRTPDVTWWSGEAELLALAGQAGSLNTTGNAYDSDAQPTSPWLEHLLILMLETAPLGNCNPRQMDALYRIIRWLEPHFMVRESYSAQAPFHTRLDATQRPKKITGSLPPGNGDIYFGPGMAFGHLVKLRAQIKSDNARQPAWLLPAQCTQDQALPIIDALIMHWSERPPQRLATREAKQSDVRVINGFAQLRRMVAFSEFARSGRKIGYSSHFENLKFERRSFADTDATADRVSEQERDRWADATPLETIEVLETAGDKQMMDDWRMLDASETGIGTIANFLKPWMVIGAFIGYRLTDEVDWRVGILRRIHRKDTGHPSVGIQTYPETPLCASVTELRVAPDVSPRDAFARANIADKQEDAIVISQNRALALIPAKLFAANQFLVLAVGGHREPIRMLSVVHSHDDCACIQYEVLDN